MLGPATCQKVAKYIHFRSQNKLSMIRNVDSIAGLLFPTTDISRDSFLDPCLLCDYQLGTQHMNQKMSKAYKIFGPSQRGIETIQGRNAQIAMSMAKRYETDGSNQASQREQVISPFMGYNPSESSLALSQVSDVNIQTIKRVAKEEFDRFSKQNSNKNEYKVLRTEIRSMKELMFELQHKFEYQDKQSQELKEELHDQVKKITEDYQQESLKRLRDMSIKMNEKINKQVQGQLNQNYLPSSFVDVVQKLINELEDRIVLIQSKMDGKGGQNTSDNPVVLAETVDLRLKKMEREIESVKKSHSELMVNVRQEVEPALEAIRKKHQNSEQNLAEHEKKMGREKEEFLREIKKLSTNLEDLQNENRGLSAKLQTLNDEFSDKTLKSSTLKDFAMNSQSMTTSVLLQHEAGHEKGEQKQKMMAASNQSNEKNPSASKGDNPTSQSKAPQQLITPSKRTSTQKNSMSSPPLNRKNAPTSNKTDQSKEIEYRIDSQNRLLDQNNSYILDENGQEVVLTQEQVNMLRKSELVALQE